MLDKNLKLKFNKNEEMSLVEIKEKFQGETLSGPYREQLLSSIHPYNVEKEWVEFAIYNHKGTTIQMEKFSFPENMTRVEVYEVINFLKGTK